MSDWTWPDFVNAAIALSGVGLGWYALRRTNQQKTLDLRLELRKAEVTLRAATESLPDFIKEARGSRIAVSSAMGIGRSGAMDSFKAGAEQDLNHALALARKLKIPSAECPRQSAEELETSLVEIHARLVEVDGLRRKYEAVVADDDRSREFIRQQNANR